MVVVFDSDIPSEVWQLLTDNIRSIEQLEILLLVRASSDQTWTAREIYQRVLTNEASVQQSLEKLCVQRFIREVEESTYQFVVDPDRERVLEKLAELYKEKPARVLYALYGPKRSELDAFAQAFKIRKPR
jgi:uncharacterized protein YlbG (UPF0298 family)